MKIYKYDSSYRGYDGSYHSSNGYTLAENEEEARYNIVCEECLDDDANIYIEERKVIKLESM